MTMHNNSNAEQICFIDKFFVPKNSTEEFMQRMNYNRNFIATLEGFITSSAYQQKDHSGNVTIMTIAIWENREYLNKAKESVQAEFKRINFNPAEFYQRLHIALERDLYEKLES